MYGNGEVAVQTETADTTQEQDGVKEHASSNQVHQCQLILTVAKGKTDNTNQSNLFAIGAASPF